MYSKKWSYLKKRHTTKEGIAKIKDSSSHKKGLADWLYKTLNHGCAGRWLQTALNPGRTQWVGVAEILNE